MSAITKLSVIALVSVMPLVTAAASVDDHSIRVRTGDINMSGARGQKILALRIERAAREVCDFANDRLDRQVRKIERKCREDAKASAWAIVNTYTRLGSR